MCEREGQSLWRWSQPRGFEPVVLIFAKSRRRKKVTGLKKGHFQLIAWMEKKPPSRAPTPGARDGSMPPSAEKKARNKKMAFPAHRFEGKKTRHRERRAALYSIDLFDRSFWKKPPQGFPFPPTASLQLA